VTLDGAPTAHCLHSSCATVVASINQQLRSSIGKAERGEQGAAAKLRSPSPEMLDRRRRAEEERRLAHRSRRSLAWIVAEHRLALADLIEESPVRLLDEPRDDWRRLLGLFPDDGAVWIGDTKDSCDDEADDRRKEYCRRHFRPVQEWLREAEAPGQFTCPSLFRAGVHSRSNENVVRRPFLVVESDTLGKEEVLSIFNWMRKFMRLRAVVDTAGKSVHGWFEYPDDEALTELKMILPALGCDAALFKASQPCRLPGARRGEKTQCLLWLDAGRSR
jgi:hypothetical protein